MNFTFFCLLTLFSIVGRSFARFNKEVICFIELGREPICKAVETAARRNAINENLNIPVYDPYIPRDNTTFYNCTSNLVCNPFQLTSLTQITSPSFRMNSCFMSAGKYECEAIRYNYMKNIDKLLFLSKNIPDKIFYLVDCLIYSDGERVCNKKKTESHLETVDIGNIVRPNEPNILSQEEYLCEQTSGLDLHNPTSPYVDVVCDLNTYVPFPNRLKLKESNKIIGNVLLKTGDYIVPLKFVCFLGFCGYKGKAAQSRRSEMYEPPGGKTFKCYYGMQQQVCKRIRVKSDDDFGGGIIS